MKRTCCFALAAFVLGVLMAAPSAQAQTKKVTYACTELPALSATNPDAVPHGINSPVDKSSVRVVGRSKTDDGQTHAVIWERVNNQWVIREIDYHSISYSCGINDLGQVVGVGPNATLGGFFYDDLTGVESLTPAGNYTSQALDINNSGQVAGSTRPTEQINAQAFLWEPDGSGNWVTTDLGILAGPYMSWASAINEFGQVVGKSVSGPSAPTFPFLWENVSGSWTCLNLNEAVGVSGGGGAEDINDLGVIVGTDYSIPGASFAVMWQRVNGQWTRADLSVGKPSDFSATTAYGINNLGQVVGYASTSTGGNAPFLYENGIMRDLRQSLPAWTGAWTRSSPQEINDHGQVIASAYNTGEPSHALLIDTQQVTYSYTSTGSAVTIKDNSTASKSMTLTDSAKITDLNVKVTLTHTRYADLKFELVGPNNATRLLCNAGAVTGSGIKTLVFDDEGSAGSIVPAQPLSYYDGTSTLGKWTLKITDTVKNSKTGSFTSFTLDVVPAL